MATKLFDQDALISMLTDASAKGGEQLRKAVHDATLRALQGRELTLQNIRSVLKTVSQATSSVVSKDASLPTADVEALLTSAVEGMDDALLKAVDANRVALQQFAAQGADLREKHLKKAMDDLEKLEDMMFGALGKVAEGSGTQFAGPWSAVLDKMKASGTQTGTQATAAISQIGEQMRDAVRTSRASSLKAAQALAESYSALVSGVLIGMAEALEQAPGAAKRAAAKTARKR
jgi:hypothetical protein